MTKKTTQLLAYQGFVFSEETSHLSDPEFLNTLKCLDVAANAIKLRKHLAQIDPTAALIFNPDAGWHPAAKGSFEHDGSTKNSNTSFRLLALRDRDIIRKMRLYCQAFTGYQLATLEMAGKRPWLSRKLPDDWDETLKILAGPPTAALINYIKVSYSLPTELRAVPPRKFGEIGWLVDEAIVNDDTYVYQQIISLMYENGLIDYLRDRLSKNGFLQIVEIGGGYGALAYYLTRIFEGHVHYALIDLPESLAFASIYCSTLFPDMEYGVIESTESFALPREPGFTFVPNMLYHNLCVDDRLVDLCINTGSMAEMSATQVNDYCESIGRFMGDTGIFFEQNHSEYPLGQEKVTTRLKDITIRHFKNLRKCTTTFVPTYPNKRGTANFWVNLASRDQSLPK